MKFLGIKFITKFSTSDLYVAVKGMQIYFLYINKHLFERKALNIVLSFHFPFLSSFYHAFTLSFLIYILAHTVKPLTVEIKRPPSRMVADRRYEIICESSGSRPNAIITWYKGKRQLRRTKVSFEEN